MDSDHIIRPRANFSFVGVFNEKICNQASGYGLLYLAGHHTYSLYLNAAHAGFSLQRRET